MNDHWDMLRSGQHEVAIDRMLKDCAERPFNIPRDMELGVAYLWLRKFDLAHKHFQTIAYGYPHRLSTFFDMLGVAAWCLKNRLDAVKHWTDGLESDYADAAGGLHIPILLLAASSLAPGMVVREDIVRIIEDRLRNPRASYWPGPLAAYATGRLSDELLDQELQRADVAKSPAPQLQADFFRATRKLPLDEIAFAAEMKRISALSWHDYDADKTKFLRILWTPEFHLARRESRQTSST